MIEFNPHSTLHLGFILFGGRIKNQEQIQIGLYKTGKNKGQPKYKWIEKVMESKGLGLRPTKDMITDKGNISLNDKHLSRIAKKIKHPAGQIAKFILELRELQKEISTYYKGFEELIYDHDNCIHGNLNHVSTDTGRLSSNKPNLQNLPRS